MKKDGIERNLYIFCTVSTLIGFGLSMAGLLLPNWYKVSLAVGGVMASTRVGPWHQEVCVQGVCDSSWAGGDTDLIFLVPYGELIRWFETAGCIVGFLALLSLIPLWRARFSQPMVKHMTHTLYFATVMLSGFACVVGTLVIASKVDDEFVEWAPFFSGIGGAMHFIAGCMACVVCRYDSTYGTLENPVSPAFERA